MPNLWSAATITRFSQQAENIFAREVPCIIDRKSIAIVSGTHTYTLDSSVIDIRKVTWKGTKLDPAHFRDFVDSNLSITRTGTPTDYIFNNIGQNQIRFFPIPNVSISSTSSNLFGSAIPDRVIYEFYRMPDYSTYIIPDFFRRRLIKAYVLSQCYAIEGKGQDLKAAKYWENKWNYLKEVYSSLLDELINSPRRIIVGPGGMRFSRDGMLSKANLSSDFGIGVREGE